MLINFSNHPSASWSDAQMQAAAVYGDIIDMPFPSVPPEADEEAVGDLADICLEKILATGQVPEMTVHIMGEQTLCFALILRLQRLGIPCVASCSARDVRLQPDGSKVVGFHFVRFRRYPWPVSLHDRTMPAS